MRVPTSLRWVGLALLGLVIAAAIALAASRLASRQIGIASESVSAGNSLAPPLTAPNKRRRDGGGPASEAGEGRRSNTQAEESGPEVPEESSEAEVPVAPVEPTEPRSDDGGGGQTKGGGGHDD